MGLGERFLRQRAAVAGMAGSDSRMLQIQPPALLVKQWSAEGGGGGGAGGAGKVDSTTTTTTTTSMAESEKWEAALGVHAQLRVVHAKAWLDQLGPISGGPPSVYVAGHGVYLGLAHVKLWKKQGRGTATSAMIYKDVGCEEHAQPPSSPHTSSPHKQPSCTPNHDARPVATGTPLRRRRPFVFWASHRLSLSRRNCHQRRQSSSRPAC